MHPIKDWNISEVTILSGYIRFSCFWLFIVLICIPAENELWARRLVLVIAVSNTSLNCAVYFHFTVHAVPYLCLDYCCRWFQSAPLVCLRYKSILKIKDRFELLSFSLIVLKSKSVNQHQTFNFSKRSYDKEKKINGEKLTLTACWYSWAFLETLFKSDSFLAISDNRFCRKEQS